MERLVTLKHAARILSVSPEFLKKAYRTGRVRVVRFGRAVRIPAEEIDRLARDASCMRCLWNDG